MTIARRQFIALSASVALPSLAPFALAQTPNAYPNRPIRVIVPFPVGGGTDLIARDVMNKLSTTLGWTFVIDNRAGSGGNVGIDAAAKATPDGYTIALGQTSNLSINPTLYAKMPYDVARDLTPIVYAASAALALVVAADSPHKTLADVIAASKAKPAALNFASPGNGTVTHLASESFQRAAGIKWTHVPYKGSTQAITDLLGGQVQLYMASVPTLIGQIRGGKMRALAVTSRARVDDLPNVPTIAEGGFGGTSGFEAATWYGFVAPTGTPKEIVARLNREIGIALRTPDLKLKLAEQGATAQGGSPEQFGAWIRAEAQRWAPIIKESGAKVD